MPTAGEREPSGEPGRRPGRIGGWRLWGAVAVGGALLLVAILVLGGGGETRVPSVVGLGEEAATDAVVATELSTQVDRQPSPEPPGTVVDQDPEPGTELGTGDVVTLTVSGQPEGDEGDEQPTGPVDVPDVVGEQYVLAGASIERLGLIPETRAVQRGQAWGEVVAQRPQGGATLDAGERVELEVALDGGVERLDIPVPELEEQAAGEARTRAHELGFTTRTVDRDAPSADLVGTVLEQDPQPGGTVPELSRITLVVGR